MIFPLTPIPYYHNPPVYKGIMDYKFESKVVYNKGMLDVWFAEHGRLPSLAEITFLFSLIYPPEILPILQYVRFTGNGYVTEGGEGRAVVNQVGILDKATGQIVWPKDITIVVP